MPRDDRGGHGKSKPELITEVLTADPDRPGPQVQTAVWERFGEAVTAREIAAARRKLRQASAPPPPKLEAARVKKEKPKKAAAAEPTAKPPRRPTLPRVKDAAAAEVTVGQLSAILDVAEEVGGLRPLREAVDVVARLRERVGGADDRQLAYALDFLARLTGAT